MTCWWIFGHRWGKWAEVDRGTIFSPISNGVIGRYVMHKRLCEACGRIQVRRVNF